MSLDDPVITTCAISGTLAHRGARRMTGDAAAGPPATVARARQMLGVMTA